MHLIFLHFSNLLKIASTDGMEIKPLEKKIIKDATSTKSRLILHDNRHPLLPYTLIQTN